MKHPRRNICIHKKNYIGFKNKFNKPKTLLFCNNKQSQLRYLKTMLFPKWCYQNLKKKIYSKLLSIHKNKIWYEPQIFFPVLQSYILSPKTDNCTALYLILKIINKVENIENKYKPFHVFLSQLVQKPQKVKLLKKKNTNDITLFSKFNVFLNLKANYIPSRYINGAKLNWCYTELKNLELKYSEILYKNKRCTFNIPKEYNILFNFSWKQKFHINSATFLVYIQTNFFYNNFFLNTLNFNKQQKIFSFKSIYLKSNLPAFQTSTKIPVVVSQYQKPKIDLILEKTKISKYGFNRRNLIKKLRRKYWNNYFKKYIFVQKYKQLKRNLKFEKKLKTLQVIEIEKNIEENKYNLLKTPKSFFKSERFYCIIATSHSKYPLIQLKQILKKKIIKKNLLIFIIKKTKKYKWNLILTYKNTKRFLKRRKIKLKFNFNQKKQDYKNKIHIFRQKKITWTKKFKPRRKYLYKSVTNSAKKYYQKNYIQPKLKKSKYRKFFSLKQKLKFLSQKKKWPNLYNYLSTIKMNIKGNFSYLPPVYISKNKKKTNYLILSKDLVQIKKLKNQNKLKAKTNLFTNWVNYLKTFTIKNNTLEKNKSKKIWKFINNQSIKKSLLSQIKYHNRTNFMNTAYSSRYKYFYKIFKNQIFKWSQLPPSLRTKQFQKKFSIWLRKKLLKRKLKSMFIPYRLVARNFIKKILVRNSGMFGEKPQRTKITPNKINIKSNKWKINNLESKLKQVLLKIKPIKNNANNKNNSTQNLKSNKLKKTRNKLKKYNINKIQKLLDVVNNIDSLTLEDRLWLRIDEKKWTNSVRRRLKYKKKQYITRCNKFLNKNPIPLWTYYECQAFIKLLPRIIHPWKHLVLNNKCSILFNERLKNLKITSQDISENIKLRYVVLTGKNKKKAIRQNLNHRVFTLNFFLKSKLFRLKHYKYVRRFMVKKITSRLFFYDVLFRDNIWPRKPYIHKAATTSKKIPMPKPYWKREDHLIGHWRYNIFAAPNANYPISAMANCYWNRWFMSGRRRVRNLLRVWLLGTYLELTKKSHFRNKVGWSTRKLRWMRRKLASKKYFSKRKQKFHSAPTIFKKKKNKWSVNFMQKKWRESFSFRRSQNIKIPWVGYLAFNQRVYIKQNKKFIKTFKLLPKRKSQKIYRRFWQFMYSREKARNAKNFFALRKIFWKFWFYFYGKITWNRYLKNFSSTKHIKPEKINRSDFFYSKFERRADVLVYRSNWGKSIQWARAMVLNNFLFITNFSKNQ